jgi:hypothetical protein
MALRNKQGARAIDAGFLNWKEIKIKEELTECYFVELFSRVLTWNLVNKIIHSSDNLLSPSEPAAGPLDLFPGEVAEILHDGVDQGLMKAKLKIVQQITIRGAGRSVLPAPVMGCWVDSKFRYMIFWEILQTYEISSKFRRFFGIFFTFRRCFCCFGEIS